MTKQVRHPAKFSDPILEKVLSYLDAFCMGWRFKRILDPFAGTGKIRQILPNCILNELEPEWLLMSDPPGNVGDATMLPYVGNSFDIVVTSPVYGNRMSDSFTDHQKHKNYKRNTYTHAIGRKLHSRNTGKLQWGQKYRDFHLLAWDEVYRVVKYSGLFLLNVSDHVRGGDVMPVTDWHIDAIQDCGFVHLETFDIETRRNGYGQNRSARVEFEHLIVFYKPVPF